MGNGEKVMDLLTLLKDEHNEMTFKKAVPMPKELEDTESPTRDDVPQEERDRLMKAYGATNWYDWRLANWGCKWDASDSRFWKYNEDWIISFSTPWGPPIEFLQTLSKQFKNMTFVLQYADESQGCQPMGEATVEDGVVSYDGPEELTPKGYEFGEMVWDEEWVDDWRDLEGIEEEDEE